MSKLPTEHRFGNRAASAVRLIFATAGIVLEEIKNDYGEDFFSISHLEDEVDPFRIWIQVKGRTLTRNKNRNFSLRLPVEQLRRWAAQIEPILLCVFDSETEGVYAFWPTSIHALWDLSTCRSKSKTFYFTEESLLIPENIPKLFWGARINYYATMLAIAHAGHHYDSIKLDVSKNLDASEEAKSGPSSSRKLALTVCLEFLKKLGIVEKNGLSKEFRESVVRSAKILTDVDEKNRAGVAYLLLLLGRVGDVGFSPGLPINLILQSLEMIREFMTRLHQEDWQRFRDALVAGRGSGLEGGRNLDYVEAD